MSRLQTALRGMPAGSYLTKEGLKIERELRAQQFRLCQNEVLVAKRIQKETGASWASCLQQAKQLIENEME